MPKSGTEKQLMAIRRVFDEQQRIRNAYYPFGSIPVVDELESRLAELSDAIQSLSAKTSRPKTAFELLNTARYEDAWQAYLAYFLDPNEPHGLGGQFLTQFFDLLETDAAISFSPPLTGLDSSDVIDVTRERQSDEDNRPDIIVTSSPEWFLCIELKVHSSEDNDETPQTVRYANDSRIVPGGVESYENGGYIYIKPASAPQSSADEFGDLDWEDVRTVIDGSIARTSGSAPARTLAQLADFSTLIESQLTMTNLNADTERRKDLYFEYREAIQEAQNAVKPFVETVLQQNWAESLETEFSPANAATFDWRYHAVGEGYGQIRLPRWETAKSDPENLDVHWEHKPTEGDFKKGRLRFILELEEPNRSTMDRGSGDRYHQFRDDILDRLDEAIRTAVESRWAEYDVNPGRSQKKLVRFVYEFQPGDEDGYYQCLQCALEDTQPVTELVTETVEQTDYLAYPAE